MMSLIESLFDVAYLGVVIALGIRLILEKVKGSKLYGIMALTLGFGDAFHLIPRILAHLTENGFEKYATWLSIGQLITGITMALFYVLFFMHYRARSNDRSLAKSVIVAVLVVARLVMVSLPQNNWGGEGNYLLGILRNVPFAILGGFIIVWCYQKRHIEGLKYTSICILVSFICYLVVVIGANFVKPLGAFMMPKTIAYVLLIVIGYRYFIRDFHALNLLKMAFVFAILGLLGGVFYREFSKGFLYTEFTTLNIVHVHLLALGFVFYLLLFAILQHDTDIVKLKWPLIIYNCGLTWTVVSFVVRGIYTITANGATLFKDAALSGIAGIGHIILAVGLVYTFIRVLNIKCQKAEAHEQ